MNGDVASLAPFVAIGLVLMAVQAARQRTRPEAVVETAETPPWNAIDAVVIVCVLAACGAAFYFDDVLDLAGNDWRRRIGAGITALFAGAFFGVAALAPSRSRLLFGFRRDAKIAVAVCFVLAMLALFNWLH